MGKFGGQFERRNLLHQMDPAPLYTLMHTSTIFIRAAHAFHGFQPWPFPFAETCPLLKLWMSIVCVYVCMCLCVHVRAPKRKGGCSTVYISSCRHDVSPDAAAIRMIEDPVAVCLRAHVHTQNHRRTAILLLLVTRSNVEDGARRGCKARLPMLIKHTLTVRNPPSISDQDVSQGHPARAPQAFLVVLW